ncbi:uncharacterized protein [Rhodnius prolixus]|uniref:uncharacterized protein n=1 Tax=Rhodnius prolixus TaxID=13249 RepID=UPI003D18820F
MPNPACVKCGKSFSRPYDLKRHVATCSPKKCPKCGSIFHTLLTLKTHVLTCSPRKCPNCASILPNLVSLLNHVSSDCTACDDDTTTTPPVRTRGGNVQNPKKYRLLSVPLQDGVVITALNRSAQNICIKNTNNIKDPVLFLQDKHGVLLKYLLKAREDLLTFKSSIFLECVYSRYRTSDLEQYTDGNFKTSIEIIDASTNLIHYLQRRFAKLLRELQEFETSGSGWKLHSVDSLVLRLTKYRPLGGRAYIPLPKKIANKEAIVNICNTDDYCFKYAILSRQLEKPHRITMYRKLNHYYNFDNISFPTPLKDILRFEKDNNVSVNVYSLTEKEKQVFPLMVSSNLAAVEHFDLLFLRDLNTSHYCLIQNLSRLISSQLSDHHGGVVMCKRCFKSFTRDYRTVDGKTAEERLAAHQLFCNQHKPCHIRMPTENAQLQFTNYHHKQHIPIVIYADFECLLLPVHSVPGCSSTSWSRKTHKHQVCSVGAKVVTTLASYQKDIFLYTGDDAVQQFMEYLHSVVKDVEALYKVIIPMNALSHQQQEDIANATHCGICEQAFNGLEKRVHHHDHLTGDFICVAHNSCNLKVQLPNFIPVYMHNLSGYDAHPIILSLGVDPGDVWVIPNSEEKYISFSKKFSDCPSIWLRFLDTYRFLPDTLEHLINNLAEYPQMEKQFPDNDQRQLLLRKGVFPYAYMTGMERMDERALPAKRYFFNDLTDEPISDSDYQHAQKVWSSFHMNTLQEYTELYLTTDIILLSDIFEQFRQCTKVKLDLLTDYDKLLMIESGIRGGITSSVTRHAKANNPYIPGYDPTQPTNYILYIDVNNLYGFAMMEHLPIGGFDWVEGEQTIDITTIPDDGDIGFILEVDLHIPTHLHDYFAQFPPLPHHHNKKLYTTLDDKHHYVIHYRNLKQALSMGVVLKQVHRILKFNQSPWLKPYIELNTSLRKAARNDFEKDFYKLMNNSVFGKCIENKRKRLSIKIVTSEQALLKLSKRVNFKDRTIFNENVIAVHLHKESIYFDRPIYVGFSILELSKHYMYHFHYQVMLKYYTPKALTLLYSDTDSYLYKIETDDVYEDLIVLKAHFDTSNYPPTHKCFSNHNKKVLGKFSDETGGDPIEEVVALRPKMYSLRIFKRGIIKKVKGIKRSAVNKITFADYLNILHNRDCVLYSSFKTILSKKHQLFTFDCNKMSLSSLDDKRFILGDGINTLPFGHYRLDT